MDNPPAKRQCHGATKFIGFENGDIERLLNRPTSDPNDYDPERVTPVLKVLGLLPEALENSAPWSLRHLVQKMMSLVAWMFPYRGCHGGRHRNGNICSWWTAKLLVDYVYREHRNDFESVLNHVAKELVNLGPCPENHFVFCSVHHCYHAWDNGEDRWFMASPHWNDPAYANAWFGALAKAYGVEVVHDLFVGAASCPPFYHPHAVTVMDHCTDFLARNGHPVPSEVVDRAIVTATREKVPYTLDWLKRRFGRAVAPGSLEAALERPYWKEMEPNEDVYSAIVMRWVIRHLPEGIDPTFRPKFDTETSYATQLALKRVLPSIELCEGAMDEQPHGLDMYLRAVAESVSPSSFEERILRMARRENGDYPSYKGTIDTQQKADDIVSGFANDYHRYAAYDPLTFEDSMRFLSDYLRSKGFDCEARIKAFVDGYPQWLTEYRAKYDPLYGEYDEL